MTGNKVKTIFYFLFIKVEKWLDRDVLSLDFKLFWIRFFKGGATACGKITKHKSWELDIFKGGSEFCFNSAIHRIDAHSIYSFNFELPKLFDFQFEIYDNREKELPKIRKKVPAFIRNMQYLKIYNLDVLNNPWSITCDLALFPLLCYLKFSFGLDKWNWALFDFQIGKVDTLKAMLKINLFCIFLEFELGENSVLRECNTYFYEDFRTLQVYGADISKQGEYDNIISLQIIRKNLAFLYALLEWHFHFHEGDYGFDTDVILLLAGSEEYFNKEIFDLVTKHINYVKDWEQGIEPFKKELDSYAYSTLCQLKDNPIPQKEDLEPVQKKSLGVVSWIKDHFRFNFSKGAIGYDWFLWLKGNGFNSFKFNWRKLDKGEYESNFQLSLTRDFWVRNYLLTNFSRPKNFSIQISHNNVWLLTIETHILGIWQIFNIGASTEDCFYNFKAQRQMTLEEHILQENLDKDIDTDEPNKRRKKYKEFYWSKWLKVYNNNYLHSPYGRTVEFSLPFDKYLKFSFNHQPYYEFKNETNVEFRIDASEKSCWFGRKSYMRFKISAFKHYFKIVLGANTIARPSVIHSDKSLEKFRGAMVDEETLNLLFQEEIEPHETWIYKKVAELGIDLSKLDFNDLIYDLACKNHYHKATFDCLLELAKKYNARFYIDEDLKNASNEEIIAQLKEWASDFEEIALNQLMEYVKNQIEVKDTK